MEIERKFKKYKERNLHSPSHALADELSLRLNDTKNFGFYLKIALTHDHSFLRRLAGEVLESKTTKKPAALFAYLIKKTNAQNRHDS